MVVATVRVSSVVPMAVFEGSPAPSHSAATEEAMADRKMRPTSCTFACKGRECGSVEQFAEG